MIYYLSYLIKVSPTKGQYFSQKFLCFLLIYDMLIGLYLKKCSGDLRRVLWEWVTYCNTQLSSLWQCIYACDTYHCNMIQNTFATTCYLTSNFLYKNSIVSSIFFRYVPASRLCSPWHHVMLCVCLPALITSISLSDSVHY